MHMQTKDSNIQIKKLGEDGSFEGYGAIFDNVDSYGETIVKGAFTKSLEDYAQKNQRVVMLWQHDIYNPIGVWENLHEDEKGLKGRGKLNLDVAKGRETYALMKQGALSGLSIGYTVVKGKPKGNVRLLEELKLYEISAVTFPANGEARVSSVKQTRFNEFAQRLASGQPMPIKEFEDILREAGIPRSLAVQIASVGYAKAIQSESEGNEANAVAAFLQALKSS